MSKECFVYYLILVLICIFLLTNDAEHLCLSLLAIYRSFL